MTSKPWCNVVEQKKENPSTQNAQATEAGIYIYNYESMLTHSVSFLEGLRKRKILCQANIIQPLKPFVQTGLGVGFKCLKAKLGWQMLIACY